MGIFDKLKNALFEEELVEVEEPTPKPKPIKREKTKKEVAPSKPIAKKVVLPEKNNINDVVDEVKYEPTVDEDIEEVYDNEKLKFPILDDNDFKMDDRSYTSRNEVKSRNSSVSSRVESRNYEDEIQSKPVVTTKKLYGKVTQQVEIPNDVYGVRQEVKTEHVAYEKKEDKTYFKPSPIISPIYGILDKNYKKEDVVSKHEVRLSSYTRDNVSVDDVRKKAYGSLTQDLENMVNGKKSFENNDYENLKKNKELKDNLLVDLSSDDEKPKVSEITMGDAEEYFQDLGLEYNIDYKDSSREDLRKNADEDEVQEYGRHVKIHGLDEEDDYDSSDDIQDTSVKDVVDDTIKKEENTIYQNTSSVMINNISDDSLDEDDDDNLFDLIDSMYEKES